VILNNYGMTSSTCMCPRGLYSCHHMPAVALFAHYNISVTDGAYSWIKSTSEDSHKKAMEVFPKSSNKLNYTAVGAISVDAVQSLFEDLKMCGPTDMGWLLTPPPKEDAKDIINDIESLLFSKEYNSTPRKLLYIKEKLKLTEETIKKITSLTVGQTENPLWLIARKHRLTASNFGKVIKAVRHRE
ncbi:hypothetical protein ILUMI_17660, partial [Ignelater luminosus]